jgi:hypothetical protein
VFAQTLLAPERFRLELPLSFVFDRSVLSQNRTTYSNWRVHSRDKHDWLRRVQVAAGYLSGQCLAYSVWQLERQYAGRHRLMDHANVVGGAKALIDCLVDLRIIRDDSPTHFTCSYLQNRAARTQTILTLLEART